MKSFIDLEFVLNLIKRLIVGEISQSEHDYLQKVLISLMLIQKYNKSCQKDIQSIIEAYYSWLTLNFNKKNLSQKIKIEYYFIKVEIEKFFYFFNIPIHFFEKKSSFELLKELALIWNYSLKRETEEIIEFLSFFMSQIYNIPENFIQDIFTLLKSNWRPVLSPIGSISYKKFSLNEIEEYFFGGSNKNVFEAHVLPNADRLFSISSVQFKNHLFLPKQDGFDIFEAALVIHEFQHIQDNLHIQEESLFISEKNALNAERIFLNIAGTGKKGKFCWLESNLFYPLLLLQWELDIILFDAYNIDNFYEICRKHSMESISLSPLFDWSSPFQMGAYCAASMEIEPAWKNYIVR